MQEQKTSENRIGQCFSGEGSQDRLFCSSGELPVGRESVLEGIFAVVIPPTTEMGEIDRARLIELTEETLESRGVSGITCLSSQGEFAYLSQVERHIVAETVIRTVNGRYPVLVGTSAVATSEAIAYSRHAADAGASALLIAPQTYIPLNAEEVYHHYEEIAMATKLPIRVYNNPMATKFDITPGLMARLAEIEGLTSIKEASGDASRVEEIRIATKDRPVKVFNGLHSTSLDAFFHGASGWDVTLLPALMPACVELYETAAIQKDWEKAKSLFRRLLPLFTFFKSHGVNRSLRAISELIGAPIGPPRKPIAPLAYEFREKLNSILNSINIKTL